MSQLYNSNFAKGFLLFNLPIEVYFGDNKDPIKIILPTIKDFISNNEFNTFIALINNEEMYKLNGKFIAKNKKDFICGISEFYKVIDLKKIFKKIFINIEIKNGSMYFEEYEITADEFNILWDMLLVGCSFKTFDEFENGKQEKEEETNPLLKELLEKQRKAEEKIKKVKKNKKSNTDFNKITIAILSYFPQYRLEDILQFNYYTFYTLYEYAIRRESQFVTDIAAGNGLIGKKNKYKPLF